MANEIDLVVGQAAFDKITELIKRLGDVDIAFGNIATNFSNLGKGVNPQSTAELAKLTAENQKLNKALTDLKASYVTIDTELAKNTKLITDNTKATLSDTIAKREKNSQTTLEIKAGKDLAQTYSQLDAQHKLAVKSAQDLAVSTGRSTKQYEDAKNKANELGKQLRVIDTDIGKHSRNVGNYASSWNGLGNSINQLTREAPAFANSVQTGFMALSNNIPILTDELGVLIQKNKDLQAQGKPTESILKTVAGAFFSWQTAISLGVTILTVYGSKLITIATNAFSVHNNIKLATEAVLDFNDATSKGVSNSKNELAIRDNLLRIAKNEKLSMEQRKEAIKELRQSSVYYTKNITDEMFLTNKAAPLIDVWTRAIVANSKAKTQESSLSKTRGIISDIETELDARQSYFEKRKQLINDMNIYDKSALIHRVADKEAFKKDVEKDIVLLDYEEKLRKKRRDDVENNVASTKSDVELRKILNATVKETGTLQSSLNKNVKESLLLNSEAYKAPTKPKPKKDKSAEEDDKKEEENAKNKYARELSDLERSKELIQDKYDAEEEGTRMRISLSNELALSQVNIIEAQYNEEVRLANNNADLIKIADNNLATARENILKENGKRIIAEQERIHKKIGEIADEEKYGVDTYFMPMDEVQSWVAEWNRIQKDKADKDKQNAADKKKIDEEAANYLMSFGSEFASKAGFSETFNMLSGNIAGFGTNAKTTFVAVAESAQEMFNMIAEASQANFDQEYARLDKQKETSLKFAGDSTAAKEKIEADYEKKKKEIDKRKFEADKKYLWLT